MPTDDHDHDTLELVDALVEVRARFGVSASYSRGWAAATGGLFPARRVGRRWHVARADLPRVAAALGGGGGRGVRDGAGPVPAAA